MMSLVIYLLTDLWQKYDIMDHADSKSWECTDILPRRESMSKFKGLIGE